MKMNWTSTEAARATGGKIAGEWQAGAVVIDSRVVQGGELFAALPGSHADGHDFVVGALARGAAAAIVSRDVPGVSAEKLLRVDDVLTALQALGSAGRSRSGAKIVGVTGSAGKTSAKEMLRVALSAHGGVFASHGNFNNHIGMPLNLANLPADAPFAVIEMGMNHAGEISALTRLSRPHVALIVNVEAVHLEFFPSVEAIADAKAEIFEGVEPGGAAVLNRDNPHFDRLAAHAARCGVSRMLSFGAHEAADFRLVSYRATERGAQVEAVLPGGTALQYSLGALGRHFALSSLGVLACVHALGLDAAASARALAAFAEPEGRGGLVKIRVAGGEALLMDDSYNASPAAMRAAFAKLGDLRAAKAFSGRMLVALGEMRELGGEGPALHAALAGDLQAAGVERVYTACPLMRHLHEALPPSLRGDHADTAAALIPALKAALCPGDLLLIKGSHGSHMYEVAEALKIPPSPERVAGQEKSSSS